MELNKILVKTGNSYFLISKDDIELIKSERNYSRIFCEARNYIVRKSLNTLEERLGFEKFMRVNRSTIVNIDQIEQMKKADNDYVIVLKNNKIVNWGRRYRENLSRLIKV